MDSSGVSFGYQKLLVAGPVDPMDEMSESVVGQLATRRVVHELSTRPEGRVHRALSTSPQEVHKATENKKSADCPFEK